MLVTFDSLRSDGGPGDSVKDSIAKLYAVQSCKALPPYLGNVQLQRM